MNIQKTTVSLCEKYGQLYGEYKHDEVKGHFLMKDEKTTVNELKKEDNGQPRGPGDPCTNMDFEQCGFTGWDLFEGDVDLNPFGYVNVLATVPGIQHPIVSGGMDPVTGIPMVNPDGGSCSVLLGDGTGGGGRAASLTQTFQVTSNNAVFTYSYALVLEDPINVPHAPGEKPFFKVNIYDANGNSIPCGEYAVVSGSWGDPDLLFRLAVGGIYRGEQHSLHCTNTSVKM